MVLRLGRGKHARRHTSGRPCRVRVRPKSLAVGHASRLRLLPSLSPTPKGLAHSPPGPTPRAARCVRGASVPLRLVLCPERPSHARLPPQPHKHCPLPLTRHHAHYVDEVGHRNRCRDVGPHAEGAVIAEARPRGSRTHASAFSGS